MATQEGHPVSLDSLMWNGSPQVHAVRDYLDEGLGWLTFALHESLVGLVSRYFAKMRRALVQFVSM